MSELNITDATNTRQRRLRRCGHCHQTGHDRRTCPCPEMVERRRVERQARQNRLRQQQQRQEQFAADQRQQIKEIKVFNNNSYNIVIFWRIENSDSLKFLCIIDAFQEQIITFGKTILMVVIPVDEFIIEPTQSTLLSYSSHKYNVIDEFITDDYLTTEKIIYKEYKQNKSELDQWKECGLKSLYLLHQLERLGAKQNPNFEIILDMVQDIPLPTHTDIDKERAGVPSVFTNIT